MLNELKEILEGCTWSIILQSNLVINFYIETSPQNFTNIELALHEWSRMLPAMWGFDVHLRIRDMTPASKNKINSLYGYYDLDNFEKAINDYRDYLCRQITTNCDALVNALKGEQ